jgi:hypothetical protein
MQLLQKDPERRPASARVVAEMLRGLEQSLGQEPGTHQPTALMRAVGHAAACPRGGRRRLLQLGVPVLLVAAAGLGAWAWDVFRSPPRQGDLVRERDAPQATQHTGARAPLADDAWLKYVAALPPPEQVEAVAARLKERNPGFDGTVRSKIENDRVVQLWVVTDHVTDVSPVRALTELRVLSCNGSSFGKGKLADLGPLKDLDLTTLNCGLTRISDLAPLRNMKRLGKLYCSYTQVADLTPLQGLPLKLLWCQGTHVSDLRPLQGMNLVSLRFEQARVSDLTPLRGMPLDELGCDLRRQGDAEILRSLKTLKTINGKPAAEFWKEHDGK